MLSLTARTYLNTMTTNLATWMLSCVGLSPTSLNHLQADTRVAAIDERKHKKQLKQHFAIGEL